MRKIFNRSGLAFNNIRKNYKVVLLLSMLLLSVPPQAVSAENSQNHIASKHGIVAYTWNSNPSSKNSLLSTSLYTFNNGNAVTRTRESKGTYQVQFEGLSCNRGQFIVNAYGGSEYKSCRIGSWRGKKNCEVSVYCFNANGEHYDSQFNLLFID